MSQPSIFHMSPFAEPLPADTNSMDGFGFPTNSAGLNLPSLPPSLLNSAAGTPMHSLGGSLVSSPIRSPRRTMGASGEQGEQGQGMSPLMLDQVCEELLKCTRPRSSNEGAAEEARQSKRSRSPRVEQNRAPLPASKWLRDFPRNPNPHNIENLATDPRVAALQLLEDEMIKMMGQVSF